MVYKVNKLWQNENLLLWAQCLQWWFKYTIIMLIMCFLVLLIASTRLETIQQKSPAETSKWNQEQAFYPNYRIPVKSLHLFNFSLNFYVWLMLNS